MSTLVLAHPDRNPSHTCWRAAFTVPTALSPCVIWKDLLLAELGESQAALSLPARCLLIPAAYEHEKEHVELMMQGVTNAKMKESNNNYSKNGRSNQNRDLRNSSN